MDWLWNNLGLDLGLTADHARLSAIPILVGFVSLPSRSAGSPSRSRVVAGDPAHGRSASSTRSRRSRCSSCCRCILGTKILDPRNVVVALTHLRGRDDAPTVPTDAFGSVSP